MFFISWVTIKHFLSKYIKNSCTHTLYMYNYHYNIGHKCEIEALVVTLGALWAYEWGGWAVTCIGGGVLVHHTGAMYAWSHWATRRTCMVPAGHQTCKPQPNTVSNEGSSGCWKSCSLGIFLRWCIALQGDLILPIIHTPEMFWTGKTSILLILLIHYRVTLEILPNGCKCN